MNRLELNAAIERLIESGGHDEEARRTVAEFGQSIKSRKALAVEGTVMTKGGGGITGHTPEHGNLRVDDDREHMREFSKGVERERIGHFKLHREKDLIIISHFWKADPSTASETELPQEWALALTKTGEPSWFGERARRVLWTLNLPRMVMLRISRDIYIQSWGEGDKVEHPGGYVVEVVIGNA